MHTLPRDSKKYATIQEEGQTDGRPTQAKWLATMHKITIWYLDYIIYVSTVYNGGITTVPTRKHAYTGVGVSVTEERPFTAYLILF